MVSVRISAHTRKVVEAQNSETDFPGSMDIIKLLKFRTGILFFIGGIGARGEIACISGYKCHEKGKILIRAKEYVCVLAQLSNATHVMYEKTSAMNDAENSMKIDKRS